MMRKRLKLMLVLSLAAAAVWVLLGYAVIAQPVVGWEHWETRVESSVQLRVELPDLWPWNRGDGPDAWTLCLWEGRGN